MRMQFIGPEKDAKGRRVTYRGADSRLSISLTCVTGDVVDVHEETAAELLAGKPEQLEGPEYWRAWKPKALPPEGVPGAEAEGPAMHTAAQFTPDPKAHNEPVDRNTAAPPTTKPAPAAATAAPPAATQGKA